VPVERLLLIDDDDGDAEIFLDAADSRSCDSIDRIEDGESACQYLLDCKPVDLPSLIFLDLKLPLMNGKDVLRRIRSEDRLHNIPVVIFTSSMNYNDVVECYNLSANAYLVKPIDLDEFVDMVTHSLRFWGEMVVLP
jgi:DNA-binding response OmpR family regulator